MATVKVADLRHGDRYKRDDITVMIIHQAEKHTDLFGRPNLKLWAMRSDTGDRGWVLFGREAEIDIMEGASL